MKKLLCKLVTTSIIIFFTFSANQLTIYSVVKDVNDKDLCKYSSFNSQIISYNDEKNYIYDLSNSEPDRSDLLQYIGFDSYTILPKRINASRFLTDNLYPGLGMNFLHKKDITGSGISVAICGYSIYMATHPEYRDNIKCIENFISGEETEKNVSYDPDNDIFTKDNVQNSFGPMVMSKIAGQNCGIAPQSKVYYGGFGKNQDDIYNILNWTIEKNKILHNKDKIRVFCMPLKFSGSEKYSMDDWNKLVAKAEEDGIMVITAKFGANRGNSVIPGIVDPNDPDNLDGAYLYNENNIVSIGNQANTIIDPKDVKNYVENNNEKEFLIIPSGLRTFAKESRRDEFKYSYNLPSVRASVATISGIAALGFQIDPDLTPSVLRNFLLETKTENYVVNPVKFIKKVMENRLGEKIDNEVFERIDSPIVKIFTDSETGVKIYLTERSYSDGLNLSLELVNQDEADFGMTYNQAPGVNNDIDYYHVVAKDAAGKKINIDKDIVIVFPTFGNAGNHWINDNRNLGDSKIINLDDKSHCLFTLRGITNADENSSQNIFIYFIVGIISISIIGVTVLILIKNKQTKLED